MFPLTALLAHAELKTKPTPTAPEQVDARRAVRVTRYGNLTLFPRVERAAIADPTANGGDELYPLSGEAIDASWEAPRLVASISNVSATGVGLILSDELPTGLQFDCDWDERPADKVRFEVVHTKPLSAGLYRTGARLVAGELPAEPVPTPFVRRFALASEAEDAQPAVAERMPAVAEPIAAPRPSRPALSLVRDGVMALERVPTDVPHQADLRPAPAGTFRMSAAGGFEKTERLDGTTVCGWERSIEMRRDGDRMWVYVHTPGKRNGWGLFVDAEQFATAVGRAYGNAGSPFVATTLAA